VRTVTLWRFAQDWIDLDVSALRCAAVGFACWGSAAAAVGRRRNSVGRPLIYLDESFVLAQLQKRAHFSLRPPREMVAVEAIVSVESSKPDSRPQSPRWTICWPRRFAMSHGVAVRAFRAPPIPASSAAQGVRTACAELGYWRWKFLQDAVDLEWIEPVAHTAFRLRLATAVVDLREPPFATELGAWKHPGDCSATRAFARAARDADIGGII